MGKGAPSGRRKWYLASATACIALALSAPASPSLAQITLPDTQLPKLPLPETRTCRFPQSLGEVLRLPQQPSSERARAPRPAQPLLPLSKQRPVSRPHRRGVGSFARRLGLHGLAHRRVRRR